MIMYPAYTHHADPRAKEMIPSHMNMDLSSPKPPLYQPSPYASNYSYPVPHQYHGCCYYGGGPYGFWPPYTHYPPPPQPPPFHPYGLYSPFPGAYPVPPQHYSVEQPRSEYDRNHHCCGCNHREDEKRPNIQEESQVDKKTSDPPLIPLLLKDRPDCPIMWVPHGYMSNTAKEKDKYSHDPDSVKHHESSKRGGNGEDRFPFQVFWLPSKKDEVGKENNLDLGANKGLSDDKNSETSNKHAVQKVKQASTSKEETETSSKHAVQKVIPVKQVSTNEEKKSMVNSDSVDNGSRASPKTSKLPPVCLRVDPLPRKKKASRSPSPREKERSNLDDQKSCQQQAQVLKEEQSDANKVERDTREDNLPRVEGDERGKGKVEEKRNLSEHEAALIIQSVYRGFEVRKSQPLKKLRQIHQVRKQVFELRNRIQDLESSSCTDGKGKVIIGETIMSLLLKLDTIQGLHPFVREVRKSVAKELVGLQEKLDSLTFVKSETPIMCSPKQDAIQVQSQSQNHAAESQCDDDTEASKQFVKNTATEDKAPTESNTDICENQEMEGTESRGLGSNKDQSLNECDEAVGICATELESHKEQAPTECENLAIELISHKDQAPIEYENHAIESQEGGPAPTESDEALGLCETQEAEATELHSTIGEPQMESDKEQAPSECDEALELSETSAAESREACCEPQLAPIECDKACDNHATESQEGGQAPTGSDESLGLCESREVESLESDKEKLGQAPSECDEALGLSENHAAESQEGCGEPGLELHKEKLDQAPAEFENHEVEAIDNDGAEAYDINVEHNSRELNNNQLQMSSELHSVQDTNVESMMYDCAGSYNDSGAENNLKTQPQVVSCEHGDDGNVQMDDIQAAKDELVPKANEGQLMEENEKLRAAVEELMKAGNQQLGVIRELTGRVKDLEKKLSKKKKIKVNKCRRACVVQKD